MPHLPTNCCYCGVNVKNGCEQGNVFPSAKPALASLGLASCGGDRPRSPGCVRRNNRGPPRTPRASAYAATCPRPRHVCGPAYLLKEAPRRAFPPSPFGLIEELLTDDPWKMLLGCIMLNQTTRSQVLCESAQIIIIDSRGWPSMTTLKGGVVLCSSPCMSFRSCFLSSDTNCLRDADDVELYGPLIFRIF